jgi:hypothetical protein
MPTILAAYDRLRSGRDPVSPRPDLTHAENFLYMLNGEEPPEVAAETFDMALILHADPGFNASTFTSMVIASTLADMYSSITGGIGALAGPLHGGANQDVMEVLMEIKESDRGPVEWVRDALENREDWRVPGWGHRVYDVKDPRAVLLQEKAHELGESSGDPTWYEYTTAIEEYLVEERGLLEHGIAPNVDFFSGAVYSQLGIPIDMYTPIFAMSRVGGWAATSSSTRRRTASSGPARGTRARWSASSSRSVTGNPSPRARRCRIGSRCSCTGPSPITGASTHCSTIGRSPGPPWSPASAGSMAGTQRCSRVAGCRGDSSRPRASIASTRTRASATARTSE